MQLWLILLIAYLSGGVLVGTWAMLSDPFRDFRGLYVVVGIFWLPLVLCLGCQWVMGIRTRTPW